MANPIRGMGKSDKISLVQVKQVPRAIPSSSIINSDRFCDSRLRSVVAVVVVGLAILPEACFEIQIVQYPLMKALPWTDDNRMRLARHHAYSADTEQYK